MIDALVGPTDKTNDSGLMAVNVHGDELEMGPFGRLSVARQGRAGQDKATVWL